MAAYHTASQAVNLQHTHLPGSKVPCGHYYCMLKVLEHGLVCYSTLWDFHCTVAVHRGHY